MADMCTCSLTVLRRLWYRTSKTDGTAQVKLEVLRAQVKLVVLRAQVKLMIPHE